LLLSAAEGTTSSTQLAAQLSAIWRGGITHGDGYLHGGGVAGFAERQRGLTLQALQAER
jgi:hypothetical protein